MPVDKDFQINLKLEEKKIFKKCYYIEIFGDIFIFFFGVKCHYLNKQKV